MKLEVSELENGIRVIALKGSLDSNGVYSVEVDLIRHCAAGNLNVLVDLSKVRYISSIGIPMLIHAARLVMKRGGKMALLNPQRNVLEVLELVGASQIIPIFYDLAAAKAGM
ncbi:MAG: STAS domain-containing protein [Chloroflexota bacterium]|jgi:anti-sigma B factor antagonist